MKITTAIENKYLLIPVKKGMETKTVSFSVESEKIYEFEIPVDSVKSVEQKHYVFDFMSALSVSAWIGKELVIEGDVPENFLKAIQQSDVIPESGCKKPLLHFTPDTGWMNDPCGLLYDKGLYHLYFQHNPYSVEWGNMSWGHAISKDLLHWEQLEEALSPDEDGTIFTGSAIINEQALFGLPKDAQLYIYTSAGSSSKWSEGKKFVQKLAWSTDGGKTLQKRQECILDHIIGDNRDMKVCRYDKDGEKHYFAVMYWEKNDYAILVSENLNDWRVSQKLTLKDAWECPDLIHVPVEGGGEKWVFWTADGYYFVGEFDGYQFEHDGIRREAYQTMLPYAAQSFCGTERVISIPWIRTDNAGKVRRGMMGLPRQLTLAEVNGEYILRQKVVEEFEQCKEKMLQAATDDEVCYHQEEECVIEVILNPIYESEETLEKEESGAICTVDIYGTKIVLEKEKLLIYGIAERSSGVKDAVCLGDKEKLLTPEQDYRVLEFRQKPEKISLISDGEILEITVNDGIMGDAFETVADEKCGQILITPNRKMNFEISRMK